MLTPRVATYSVSIWSRASAKATAAVFAYKRPKGLSTDLAVSAKRKLDRVDTAEVLDDLRVPPGNRLEALSGNRAGQHSIRIKDQWRVCFVWRDGDAYEVEVVDHQ